MNVRNGSKSKSDSIGELPPTHQEDGLKDLLLAESIRTQGFDVGRPNLGRLAVELGAEIQKSLVSNRDLGMNVVDRDLLRFRTVKVFSIRETAKSSVSPERT